MSNTDRCPKGPHACQDPTWHVEYPGRDYFETDETTGLEIPMTCNDCGRPAYYDYDDPIIEGYHHAVEPARACFLIPSEDRPADTNHPLVV